MYLLTTSFGFVLSSLGPLNCSMFLNTAVVAARYVSYWLMVIHSVVPLFLGYVEEHTQDAILGFWDEEIIVQGLNFRIYWLHLKEEGC